MRYDETIGLLMQDDDFRYWFEGVIRKGRHWNPVFRLFRPSRSLTFDWERGIA